MTTAVRRRRWAVRWLTFPAIVLVGFTVLVTAQVSGSSIAILTSSEPAAGLIAGEPLPVRSDEFLLTTPSNISSVLAGFPTDPWIGLAPTDLDVAVHSGVTLNWTSLFHPDDWGYIVAGASYGLAFSWWWSFAISLWGMFALIGLLTKAPVLSAALAVAATFTPYSAWWSAAPPSLLLGYAAVVGACLIAAWQTARVSTAIVFSVVGGLFGAALTLVLYPPWSVSMALVVAAVCTGYAIDRRHSWRRVGWTIGVVAGVAGGVLLGWYLANTPAIEALAGTSYPGSRTTIAGDADPLQLMSAPLNPWLAGEAGATLGTNPGAAAGANLSGVSSSWIPLPAILLLLAGVLELVIRGVNARRAHLPRPGELRLWTLGLLSAMTLLLLAWAVLPLPEWVGAVTQLNRVQASRTPLAVGSAVVLLAAVASRVSPKPRSWSVPWAIAGASATAALTLAVSYSLPWESSLAPIRFVLLSGFVLAAAYALIFCVTSGALAAGAAVAFAVYAMLSWGLVNPLQRGIEPLSHDPLVVVLQDLAAVDDNPRTMVFADFRVVAKVRAAGLQSISGQTPIPDAAVMARLLPDNREDWNNYRKYQWYVGEPGSDADLAPLAGSTMALTIDPCSRVLAEVADPGWAVSAEPILGAKCLEQAAQVPGIGDGVLFVYRVVP